MPGTSVEERRVSAPPGAGGTGEPEHFKPIGTVFLLGVFVATIILLWVSVYVILISRGVTT
jgi:hypothetical protein